MNLNHNNILAFGRQGQQQKQTNNLPSYIERWMDKVPSKNTYNFLQTIWWDFVWRWCEKGFWMILFGERIKGNFYT
jgi:hypothetical protein